MYEVLHPNLIAPGNASPAPHVRRRYVHHNHLDEGARPGHSPARRSAAEQRCRPASETIRNTRRFQLVRPQGCSDLGAGRQANCSRQSSQIACIAQRAHSREEIRRGAVRQRVYRPIWHTTRCLAIVVCRRFSLEFRQSRKPPYPHLAGSVVRNDGVAVACEGVDDMRCVYLHSVTEISFGKTLSVRANATRVRRACPGLQSWFAQLFAQIDRSAVWPELP